MKIIVKDGILWKPMDVMEADEIARANDFPYAERLVNSQREGVTLTLDDKTKKIKEIEEGFL